jgi:hypothetical protein
MCQAFLLCQNYDNWILFTLLLFTTPDYGALRGVQPASAILERPPRQASSQVVRPRMATHPAGEGKFSRWPCAVCSGGRA